jgi:hypothetical protein
MKTQRPVENKTASSVEIEDRRSLGREFLEFYGKLEEFRRTRRISPTVMISDTEQEVLWVLARAPETKFTAEDITAKMVQLRGRPASVGYVSQRLIRFADLHLVEREIHKSTRKALWKLKNNPEV